VKGFEPSTSCLGSKHSTAELHPPAETSKARFQVTGYSESSQKFTSQLLDDFITSRTSGTTQKTITLYHFALDRFIGYPLTPEGINGYLNSLTCGNAKHNYFRCIRTLCRWLYQNDYIASNPIEKVSPPRRQKKLLPTISQEQLQALLNYCNCERDKALISLLWYSGMRISEAVNIKACDFNWEEGTVIVLGKGNRYRKCLAGNGLIRQWFSKHVRDDKCYSHEKPIASTAFVLKLDRGIGWLHLGQGIGKAKASHYMFVVTISKADKSTSQQLLRTPTAALSVQCPGSLSSSLA